MGALGAAVIIYFVFAWLRRGRAPVSFPPGFWIWAGKFGELNLLLFAFAVLDPVGQILLAPAFVLLLAPSFFLKQIVIPLGMPRVAYWMARWFGPVRSIREAGAGAALYGALALARRRRPTPAIAWLEQKANRAKTVRGAGVVAAALLAGLRGDRRRARALFLVADTLPRKFIPRSALVVARDWLAADAARIGDWREVMRVGLRGRDSMRWSYALARVGERLIGDPNAPRDWRLWLGWAIAPRRLATLPLLRQALAVPRAPDSKPVDPDADAELPAALADLAHVLENRFARDGASLARRVGELDGALDRSTTRALVQQRLLALGAQRDADAIISGFRARLVDLLAPVIEESPRLAGGQARGPILDQAIERVRNRLLRDVEAQCKDYGERQQRETPLDILAEWGAWALMRDSADRLLELAPEQEHSLFHTMYVPTCNFAVYQHNKCKRPPLAHEIFSWLRRHSRSDAAASKLLTENMRAGAN
jgi:hypothetical protein